MMASIRHGFDRGSVFGRRHSGYLFKLSGKVVDRGVPKFFRNLCKIHLFGADQFFGSFDLHIGKVFDDAKAGFFAKDFLEL